MGGYCATEVDEPPPIDGVDQGDSARSMGVFILVGM